ncbi:MAG: hypothetical protein A2W27_00175 [Deltaproteobacteria bacterium RBG_16_44_11]|nr:MAG: hypothetical protein A2W27_00175 [Deltaproteobacteria bacterium RBG_16_44_11]
MKTTSMWNFRSIAGKIMMGLVLTAMIGSIAVAPSFGKDNRRGHDNRRYEQHRGRSYHHGRPVYRHYGYYGHRERVYYPPPPVVYAPPPPPGIGIFFPPIFIHP